MNRQRLIFGLGSGRCGTTSLAHLFNIQINTFCTHERYIKSKFKMPFEPIESEKETFVRSLFEMTNWNIPVVGDIAYYWLHYVPWVMAYIEDPIFVCLKRTKEKTIESFINAKPRSEFFESIKDKLNEYYDDYYEVAENYVKHYPEQFKIFPITDLNDMNGQMDILNFCGYKEDKQYQLPLKLNVLNSV